MTTATPRPRPPDAAPPRPSTAEGTLATAASLRLSVTRLARALRRHADTGLTPSQLSALATVERHGPLPLGALAEREGVAAPTVTRVVAKLADDGLVRREADPDDRRSTLVVATADGRALLTRSRKRKTAWLAARVERLDDDDLARLDAALAVLDRLASDDRGEGR